MEKFVRTSRQGDPELTSGERLYLQSNYALPHARAEHLERYEFAAQLIPKGAVVLDAACGSGYGSQILAQSAARVIGLDISQHAVEWAKENHSAPNTEFRLADLNAGLALDAQSVDAIVSFETIEHLQNQAGFLAQLESILKPGGILVISTPDADVAVRRLKIQNQFHISDLTKESFLVLLRKFFDVPELYGQGRVASPTPLHRILHIVVIVLAAVDVLKLRRLVRRLLGLPQGCYQGPSAFRPTNLERVDPNTPGEHLTLTAVCRKRRQDARLSR
jgi:SAM-dependent methyltransferase